MGALFWICLLLTLFVICVAIYPFIVDETKDKDFNSPEKLSTDSEIRTEKVMHPKQKPAERLERVSRLEAQQDHLRQEVQPEPEQPVALTEVMINEKLEADQSVILNDLHFGVESSRLNGNQAGSLGELAKVLETHQSIKLIIEGHTDHLGSELRNRQLSLQRAESVQDILIQKFKIDPERLAVRGRGSSAPIADRSYDGRRLNRRVEIRLAGDD